MRRIRNYEYGAYATQGATAPMRRIRSGVIGGGACTAGVAKHRTNSAAAAGAKMLESCRFENVAKRES